MNGEVNQRGMSVGATLLGTAIECDRQLVPGRGASAQYWTKQTLRNSSAVTHQYVLASQNGLGCALLTQTTSDRYGPGTFSLVTQEQGRNTTPEPVDDETIKFFDAHHVEQLKDTQRLPEWFNKRQFWITGTRALTLGKRYAHLTCSGGAAIGGLS